MRQGLIRQSPALVVAILALFVALGGSVYAAKRAKKIDGKTIKTKSIPGDRLKPHSVAANRLKAHSISAGQLMPHSITADQIQPHSITLELLQTEIPEISARLPLTGAEINELTLEQVPSAAHADTADTAISAETAQTAVDAQTALNAVNAVNAQTVNGYSVGCMPETVYFASACWDSRSREAVNAPAAANKCAENGGELPDALTFAALAKHETVRVDAGDEWSNDIPVISGPDVYAVTTVSERGVIYRDLSTETHKYHCVYPLVNFH